MATETTTVQAIHTLEAWTQQLDAANASGKLVVVDFTASWCGPCRAIAPSFADFSKKYPQVVFLKVDVDERQEIAGEWKVEAMPTFVFLKNGVEVGRTVGADKKKLEAKIQELSKE